MGGEPQIGDVLDSRYRITGVLGSGGMGSVYRAEHVAIRRPVAIKVLHPDFAADPDYSKRFQREAFVTGRADHPNCVTVSDFGPLAGGGFYLVMELVDGVVLGDLLGEVGRLPVGRALRIARHILRGLGHAHRAGIVHRDVKPNNIVLIRQGDDPDFAKLLDFGIAKMVEGAAAAGDAGDQQITRIGMTVGTPTYVAPEQAVGAAVDPRSDLYSLSIVLYEMIAGQPPFRAEDTVKLLAKHLSSPVPAMAELVPGLEVPPAVEEIIRVGLAKERASRHASADDYAAAIDDLFARGLVDAGARGRARSRGGAGTSGVSDASGTAAAALSSGPMARLPSGPGAIPITAAGPAFSPRARAIAAAAGGVLLIIIIIVASRGRGGPPAPPPTAPAVVAPAAPPLPALIRPAPAPDTRADEARGELARGRSGMAERRPLEALEAYRRAIALDPRLATDAVLAADIEGLVRGRDGDLALAAVELLGQMKSDRAGDLLVALANRDRRNAIRRTARTLADKRGAGDRVDRLASYSLDLQYGKTCEDRAEAVPVLRELGDERAIPVLERARRRRAGGILGFGGHSINGCMKDQLEEAIAHLKQL